MGIELIEFEGLGFKPLREEDIAAIGAVMKRAFDEDARRHLGEAEGGPPGYDDGSFLRKFGLEGGSESWSVWKEGAPLGALILWVNANGENFLGNMFVDPDSQDRGMGRRIWAFAESRHPSTRVWRTETPGFSKRNHNFYVNKCGFKIIRIENPGDPREENYIMEKIMA